MLPVITLGICVKDGEKTLPATMRSITEQDFPRERMEVIFVDDGSKDRTLSIMTDFARKNILKTKIYSDLWKGIGYARNKVYKNTEGKYIIWVDSDNVLSKSFVSKQYKFMKLNKDVGIGVGLISVRNQENPILKIELAHYVTRYNKQQNWDVHTTKLPGAAGTIFRKKVLDEIGGYDEHISFAGEDQAVVQKILKTKWKIRSTSAIFYETKGELDSLSKLWRKYIWYGNSSYKMRKLGLYELSILRNNPLAGFIAGAIMVPSTYMALHEKVLFLAPFHYSFKMLAWLVGYNDAKSER